MGSLVAALPDLLAGLGRIEARRMFGGHGIFHEGLMFALVIDDELFLKADASSAADFSARGLAPFTYTAKGRRVSLSYFRAPEELFDDPAAALHWGRLALDAARRAQAARRRMSSRPKGQPSSRPSG